MKLPSRRRTALVELPGVTGPARLDRRTTSLIPRLRAGDVAVIDHLDLDRASAEALLEARVAAVVNASSSISGRFPNLGPELLARAGVPLVDGVGGGVFTRLRDGAAVRVHEGALLVGAEEIARGRWLGTDEVAALMVEARSGLTSQLQSFTHNTTEFLRREQELLLHGEGIPQIRTPMAGRPVVVVVRGYDYREDLRRLRRYVREQHPVLVAVDAGADALLAAGHRADVLVVGVDGLTSATSAQDVGGAVSDRALRGAREIVLHTDRSGQVAGGDRLDRLGLRHQKVATSGTSEDVALLMSDVRGASLIVAVGTHATLEEFLDRQRAGLASTFLTRLRVGPKLVDAGSVPQLYAGRVRVWQLLLVLLAGLVALAVAIAATPGGAAFWPELRAGLSDVLHWIRGLLR